MAKIRKVGCGATEPKPKSFKYLRLPQVCEMFGISKPSIYRLMKEGKFPLARRLGYRSVGWLEPELKEFAESRPVIEL